MTDQQHPDNDPTELRRRRALARLSKPQLIDRVIELERNQADPLPLVRR